MDWHDSEDAPELIDELDLMQIDVQDANSEFLDVQQSKKQNLDANNSVKKKKTYRPDFYLPDYDIYLEHWAIADNQPQPEWFEGDPGKYSRIREWKRAQFKKHRKILWETNYEQWKHRQLDSILQTYCERANIPMQPRPMQEILQQIGNTDDIRGILKDQIISFVEALKTHGFDHNSFTHKLNCSLNRLSSKNIQFFILIADVLKTYENTLKIEGKIDFSDMINRAGHILQAIHKISASHHPLRDLFRYSMIFVDEYQDISPQRFNLLVALRALNENCKLFCVGDDWQAIYGFSGASNTYLTKYTKYFDHCTLNFLTWNYRNAPSILAFASDIIKNTKEYINKTLVPKSTEPDAEREAIYIKRIDANSEHTFLNSQAENVTALIKTLIDQGWNPHEIMVLSRFNFGLNEIKERCESEHKIPIAIIKEDKIVKPGVRFYSCHKSKGLEADVVIIVNLCKGLYGFPSEIQESINYRFISPNYDDGKDEEARLFFVSLTRARKRVYLFTRKNYESEFLPPPPDDTEHLFNAKNTGYLTGRVIKETEKAICLEIQQRYNQNTKMWIPKSVISTTHYPNPDKIQNIHIKKWWIQKIIHESFDTRSLL